MIKKRLFIILIPFLLFACEEEKPLVFDEEPGIYFSSDNIRLSYDFTAGKSIELDEWGWPMTTYLGDSLRHDTITFDVHRSGKLVEGVNSFNLKQIEFEQEEGKDKLDPFEIEFFNPYTFDDGDDDDARVTVKVVFHRPESRGLYKTAIGIELSESGKGFVNTIDEFSKVIVSASDRYNRPQGWKDETSVYGPFSEEKYAFYITVLGAPYYDWHEYNGWDYLPKLREALDEYNSTHDVPKDFTF